MRRTILAIGIVAACAFGARAQQLQPQAPPPRLDDRRRLELRELQFRQDKALIRKKVIEAEYAALECEEAELGRRIELAVARLFAELKIDPKRFALDLDTLLIVSRPIQTEVHK